MQQLTRKQISELKAVLVVYGLNVTVKKPSKRAIANALDERIAKIEAWKPETSAGRKCKANMLRWLRTPRSNEPTCSSAVLAMFGVRLGNVNPWPEGGPNQRGQMLSNGIGKGRLLLPFFNENGNCPRCVVAQAAMQTKIITTGGRGYGRRTFKQMNTGCEGYSK